MNFAWDGPKDIGSTKTICKRVSVNKRDPLSMTIKAVSIRQDPSDKAAWGAAALLIQQYPGAQAYIHYGLRSDTPKFWTDGDKIKNENTLIIIKNQSIPICENGKWCSMKIVGNYFI